MCEGLIVFVFFFQAEDGIRDHCVTGVQTCALPIYAATEGAFDITSKPLRRCWESPAREGRLPSDAEIDAARARVSMPHVQLDTKVTAVSFAKDGVELDFGAIGKGYALDRMGGLLRARGAMRALLSAGASSVLAIGGRGRGWPVDLRPRLASRRVGRLWLKNVAVGTSGAGEQFVEIDGQRYGHVVDPRSGHPA